MRGVVLGEHVECRPAGSESVDTSALIIRETQKQRFQETSETSL